VPDRRHSRREFLGLAAVGVAGVASAPRRLPQNRTLISSFLTPTFTRRYTRRRGRLSPLKPAVIAVRSSADIKTLIGKGTRTFDARQMTIVPGFIDCHNHAPGNIVLYDVVVGNPYVVEFVTISSIVDKLRAKARETPPGTWVEGYFV